MKSSAKMYVRYRNETYDISEFMKKHPGGSNTLNGMLHANIDYKFDTGMPHSPAAKYLMREYKVSTNTNDYDDDDDENEKYHSYNSDTSAMHSNHFNSISNDNNNNTKNNEDDPSGVNSNDDIPVYTDESMEVCKRCQVQHSIFLNVIA